MKNKKNNRKIKKRNLYPEHKWYAKHLKKRLKFMNKNTSKFQ